VEAEGLLQPQTTLHEKMLSINTNLTDVIPNEKTYFSLVTISDEGFETFKLDLRYDWNCRQELPLRPKDSLR